MPEEDTTEDVVDESTADDATTADETADEPLGAAGVKALEAEKAKRRELAAELRRYKALGTADDLARLKAAPVEAEAEIDKVRREAVAEATRTANVRIVRAELKAAATGVLADPTDALAFIDLSTFAVSDDGEVDAEEVSDALADLLKRKPHLGAQRPETRRFTTTADQGTRNETRPSLDAQISEAQAAGDYATAIRLKSLRLSELAAKS